ncbi:hypothetical protein V8D89_010979 [Ganoderma adspersum]
MCPPCNTQTRPGFKCPHCIKPEKWCKTSGGLTQHIHSIYIELFHSTTGLNLDPADAARDSSSSPPPLDDADAPGVVETHPVLTGIRLEFELSEFLFKCEQMSQPNISFLLELWAADVVHYGGRPPFEDHKEMFKVIDSIAHGDAPWQCLKVRYTGPRPDGVVPAWMEEVYEIWFRDLRAVALNMLKNPDFDSVFNTTPYREFTRGGERRFGNLMSGNWSWHQADAIATEVPDSQGCMFVPFGFGSDKMTVSVATGQNDYYPLYMFVGNLDNSVRRAHRDSVLPLAFLAIPKAERKYADTAAFCQLKPGMLVPEVVRCPDGHFRRVIWGIGPYVADYPEQVLVANIVQGWCPACLNYPKELDAPQPSQTRSRTYTEALSRVIEPTVLWDDWGIIADVIPFTHGFPRADIFELLSGNLLHQLIKGTFKDHLVTWVGEYLVITYGEARAKELLDEIDRRLAATPPFPGLHFKQWTGDDSKGLMKIYLPAISGIVPEDVVRAMAAFLEFCYLARRAGVPPDGFSLPHQHSLDHYPQHIRNFGAPNGLCTLITEAKHIKAVKEPWQMLVTNQRNEKLAAARADYSARGMLTGTCLTAVLEALRQAMESIPEAEELAGADVARPGDDSDPDYKDDPYEDPTDDDDANDDNEDNDEGADDADASPVGGDLEPDGVVSGPRVSGFVVLARKPQPHYPCWADDLAAYVNIPSLPFLISHFIFQQLNPDADVPDDPNLLPACTSRIHIYHSAVAMFYAPSDPSGIGGMHREHIHATPSWRKGPAHYDCVYVSADPTRRGFQSLLIARVRMFSFRLCIPSINPDVQQDMSCALVEWFSAVGDEPDEETGLWVAEPDLDVDGAHVLDVIDARTIFRSVHLIPVFGEQPVPPYMKFSDALDSYRAYYVNRYADHHAHEEIF